MSYGVPVTTADALTSLERARLLVTRSTTAERVADAGQTAGASVAVSCGGTSTLDAGMVTSACSAPASCVLTGPSRRY